MPAKKKSAAKSAATKRASSKRRKAAAKIKPSPVLIGFLLIFSLICILSILNANGFLVKWFTVASRGLFGHGVFILPVCIISAICIMIVRRNENVSHRITCLFIMPILVGGIANNFIGYTPDKQSAEYLYNFYLTGSNLQSGGVISGGFADILNSALSVVGGTILLIIMLIFAIFVSYNFKLLAVWQGICNFFGGVTAFLIHLKNDWNGYYEYDDDELDAIENSRNRIQEKKQEALAQSRQIKEIKATQKPPAPKKSRKLPSKSIDIPLTENECLGNPEPQIQCDPNTGEVLSMSPEIGKEVSSQYDWAAYYLSDGQVMKKNANGKPSRPYSPPKRPASVDFTPPAQNQTFDFTQPSHPSPNKTFDFTSPSKPSQGQTFDFTAPVKQDSSNTETDNGDLNLQEISSDQTISEPSQQAPIETEDSLPWEIPSDEKSDSFPSNDIPEDFVFPDNTNSESSENTEHPAMSVPSEPAEPTADMTRRSVTVSVTPVNRMKNSSDTNTAPQQPMNDSSIKSQVADEISKALEEASNTASDVPSVPQYAYPPISLLNMSNVEKVDPTIELRSNSSRLIDTLKSFNIEANIINITRGPSVTRYEIQLNRGTKYSRITSLSDDISLALGASSVRIAPIPDKSAVGIEVPNTNVETVFIRDVIDSSAFRDAKSAVTFALGKDISGKCVAGDISKMPHLLIAGTTGSGKSVCINSMLISLLYKSSPEEVRLIMIDPKMIELGCYNGIPHLLIPVVTDPKKAAGALSWAVVEMMRRYKLFADLGVRDLASYNRAVINTDGGEKLPQIVIVIDELADLMLVAAHEVEESVCRVAQMARAAGMHLIIATQRPSADVITGLMKANIPSRIAFAVASQIESRIILDTTGAEKLIGRGDMLYNPLGAGKPTRVQGCLITSEEVEAVVDYIKQTGTANYSEDVMEQIEKKAAETSAGKGGSGGISGDGDSDEDEMLNPAINIVVEAGQASTSMLQRKLKLGYSRAARIIDQMEERGIVGPSEGSKPREVLITKSQWAEISERAAL